MIRRLDSSSSRENEVQSPGTDNHTHKTKSGAVGVTLCVSHWPQYELVEVRSLCSRSCLGHRILIIALYAEERSPSPKVNLIKYRWL